jgi:RNA polymerase sigma-70 factor (ECF subfamily)
VDLEGLFEEYFPAIVQFFLRKRFPPHVAQELAQETFLRAHQGRDGFRREAQPRTWLYVIAGNVYRNELRRRHAERRRAVEVSLDVNGRDEERGAPMERQAAASVDGRQCEKAMARQRIELLKGAIRELPPRMRQIFLLRMVQGRKYDEIARLMKISIQTVKSQIHQARQRLKSELEDADLERGDDGGGAAGG